MHAHAAEPGTRSAGCCGALGLGGGDWGLSRMEAQRARPRKCAGSPWVPPPPPASSLPGCETGGWAGRGPEGLARRRWRLGCLLLTAPAAGRSPKPCSRVLHGDWGGGAARGAPRNGAGGHHGFPAGLDTGAVTGRSSQRTQYFAGQGKVIGAHVPAPVSPLFTASVPAALFSKTVTGGPMPWHPSTRRCYVRWT